MPPHRSTTDAAAAPMAGASTPTPSPRPSRRRPLLVLTLVALGAVALVASSCDVPGTAAAAVVRDDSLRVLGTDGPDTITLRVRAGAPQLIDVDVAGDGTADFSFDRQGFHTIAFKGFAGDDLLVVDPSTGSFADLPITLDGGEGDDTLSGGNGAEVIAGGPGDDHIDGNQGIDSVTGGDGVDTFQWDPGDDNDMVAGGAGADRVEVNGSGANERYDVSTIGGHTRLARDVGSVVLELAEVEDLEVRPVGGADVVTANNLSGTGLSTFTADLALPDGADDAQIDELVVAPGLPIGSDGSDAVVWGLGPDVRAVNGAATDRVHVTGTASSDVVPLVGTDGADAVSAIADGTGVAVFDATPGPHVRLTAVERLVVVMGGGDDQFSAVGNLAALVAVEVDGGAGTDTLLGGNGADVLAGGSGDDVIDGNQGLDSVSGGDGVDGFQWDPGDGSDTITGGPGTDRLVFNGSGASEIYDVSTLAGHVRLTRNIGVVVLDIDDVEAMDLRPFGGADVVSVHDLTFSDLRTLTADLALFGGGDDGQIDELVVAPGLPIGWDGPTAVVSGLGAQVRAVNGAVTDRVHVTGTVVSDVVPVIGSDGADVVSTVADGSDVAVFGTTPGPHVRLTAVERLDVLLAGGDDQFSATGNVAALVTIGVDGGAGADTLLGGNGPDVLAGGLGDDVIDGNQGLDWVSGGDGVDRFQWDPGDGNDTITGGPGTDRLVFHGSGIAEIYDVTAAAGHVRLTRNIGAVVLDVDDVEAMDLRPFGGADLVTANDLSGTDLTTLTVDLALFGGGDDGQPDQVVVNGSPGDDTVGVVDDNGQVVVQGLAPTVRVAGAGPVVDRLTVNGLAGSDSITPTAAAAALILLDLLP